MSNEQLVEQIRRDWPATQARMRARFEQLRAEIGPALARGELIQCDDHDLDDHRCNCVEVDGENVVSCESCRKAPAALLEDDDMCGILLCAGCKTEGEADK